MYKDIKVDDSSLQGKRVIGRKEITAILPKEIQEVVEVAYVYVNEGQAQWVIFIKDNDGAYVYIPFSGEMLFDPYARLVNYGKIYFWRKARYLRWQKTPEKRGRKIYTVFLCRPGHMYIWREVSEMWFDDENGPGCTSISKLFRAFNYPKK